MFSCFISILNSRWVLRELYSIRISCTFHPKKSHPFLWFCPINIWPFSLIFSKFYTLLSDSKRILCHGCTVIIEWRSFIWKIDLMERASGLLFWSLFRTTCTVVWDRSSVQARVCSRNQAHHQYEPGCAVQVSRSSCFGTGGEGTTQKYFPMNHYSYLYIQ